MADLENTDQTLEQTDVQPLETPKEDDFKKEQNRIAYELRQKNKMLEDTQKELQSYKQREAEAKKAQMSEVERLKMELDERNREISETRLNLMRNNIASEYKLPKELAARLVGSDEDALRADAESLSHLVSKTKVGNVTDVTRSTGQPRTYKRSELTDTKFFQANREDIMAALKEGRIING